MTLHHIVQGPKHPIVHQDHIHDPDLHHQHGHIHSQSHHLAHDHILQVVVVVEVVAEVVVVVVAAVNRMMTNKFFIVIVTCLLNKMFIVYQFMDLILYPLCRSSLNVNI